MAKGFDNLKIKSAVKSHNKFNLDCTHLTTMDFGQIVPLYVNELVPGDKFNISANYFSRMAPLAKPTYGKFQFKTIAGFVPYYQLADDAEAFLAGKTTWEYSTPHFRTLSEATISVLFNDSEYSTNSTLAACDFSLITASTGTTKVYKKFTAKGKFAYKVLTALGYSIAQDACTSSSNPIFRDRDLNAMPILAFAKLYNDYMSQSQRYNVSALSGLLKAIKHGQQFQYNGSNCLNSTYVYKLASNALKCIFDHIYLCYENDYFTSAWQQPNAPLNTLESVGTFGDSSVLDPTPALNSNYFQTMAYTYDPGNGTIPISQRSLDFLKGFDDWVRRNNYSGSRAVQEIYSRFGIKTEDYRSNYAHVISTDVIPVQVGDVTSQASTTDALLGDYAGKGIMNGQNGFSFDASDYGVLLVLGYYTITPMNAFGYDHSVLRTEALDFYNPEFDGVGPEAITCDEFYIAPSVSAVTSGGSNVFGFTERYNSYRFGRDKITGDFRQLNTHGSNSGYTEMSVWHTGRILNDVLTSGNLVAQNPSVNVMPQTGSEYNRIFADMNDDYDKFYLTCQFNVSAVRPMLSLNQVPRLGEGDTNVPRNGNTIS